MEFNHFYKKLFTLNVFGKHFKKTIGRLLFISLTTVFIELVLQCEGNDRFYRPNLPEKLCSIGIIDADDTTDYNFPPYLFDKRNSARYISFEKSYQAEYPEELNDSLKELSFTISSYSEELFNYKSDTTIKELRDFKIPDNIEFVTGERYYLHATEKSASKISAEITVLEPPSEPTLISVFKETTTLSEPQECSGYTTVKSATINLSFKNNVTQKRYYALLFEGTGFSFSSFGIPFSGLLDFSVRDCNAAGFFAEVNGYTMYQWTCIDNSATMIKVPIYAFFIEGSKIPDNKCIVKISTQFKDERSPFQFIGSFRIKLLSIPEELFLFEKSIYTYGKVSEDPFSEPVYLNGNIEGGNGVFAICRSSQLTINLSHLY